MAEERRVALTFENGLLESQESTLVPNGFATTLENFRPEPNGSLRGRRPWVAVSTTGAPATRKTRGIGRYPKPQAFETPAFVVAGTAAGTTAQISCTITQGTAGSCEVAVIGINGAGITVVGPDVSTNTLMSEGWVRAGYQDNVTNSQRIEYWYRLNIPGSAGTTVRFELSGTPTQSRLHVLEVSNVATVGAVDRFAGLYSTTTTVTPGSGTAKMTRTPAEFVIAAIWISSSSSFSAPSNSFTERTDAGGVSGSMATFTKAVTTIGTQSMTATASVTGTYTGAILTLKAKQSTTEVSGNYMLAAHDNTTDYSIRYIDDTNLASGSWTTLEAVTVGSTARRPVFVPAFGGVFYTSPHFSTVRRWDTASITAISDSPAGRCMCLFQNRLLVGGTFQDPYRLHWCGLSDFGTWTGTNDAGYNDVGGDEALEDCEPFGDGVLIAKRSSLWFQSAGISGPDSWRWDQLNGGGGAPGKCIVATPYGAIIAGTNAVYQWAGGGGVEIISTPIESSYQITGDFVSTAYNDGVARICDEGSGTIYCFHVPTGVWWIEKITNPTTDGPAVIFGNQEKLFYGPQSSTTVSLLAYRQEPGTTRGKDSSLAETFKAWTPTIWPSGPEWVITPKALYIQWRQRGGTSTQTGLGITRVYNGTTIAADTDRTIKPKDAAGVYRSVIPIGDDVYGKGISQAQFKFEQTVGALEASGIEIEEVVFAFDEEARTS